MSRQQGWRFITPHVLCILGTCLYTYQSIDRLTTGRSTIILAHGQAFSHTHSWISLTPTRRRNYFPHSPLDQTYTCKPPLPCSRSPRESSQHFLYEWVHDCRNSCSTQIQEVRPIERHQGTSRQYSSAPTLVLSSPCRPCSVANDSLQSQDLMHR